MTWLAMMFQWAGEVERVSANQASCFAPIMVAAGLLVASQTGLKLSLQGWSVRNWRVSTTVNWASWPYWSLR